MRSEQTFILGFPDALERRIGDQALFYVVLDELKDAGFAVAHYEIIRATEEQIRTHAASAVAKHGERLMQWNLDYLLGKEVAPVVLDGPSAVQRVRQFIGTAVNPQECDPRSIRYRYGIDSIAAASVDGVQVRRVRTMFHSAADAAEAELNVKTWLGIGRGATGAFYPLIGRTYK